METMPSRNPTVKSDILCTWRCSVSPISPLPPFWLIFRKVSTRLVDWFPPGAPLASGLPASEPTLLILSRIVLSDP